MSEPKFSATQLANFAAQYQRDGVVHIPGLLSQAWINDLLSAINSVRRDQDSARARYPTTEWSNATGRFTIRWMWRDFELVRRFFTAAGVQSVVGHVIGAERLQYWYDLTFIHDPRADGEGSPWHHDIAAFPCKGTQIPSLWIGMSDISKDMSPLQCIRGSHRNPLMFRPPVYVDQDAPVPTGYAELPNVAALIARGEYEVITWDIRAGDALLIHPYTLHGSPTNVSDRGRIAFTTRWMGDDVVWQPDALSMKVPGVDLTKVIRGTRPDGPLFPYVDF